MSHKEKGAIILASRQMGAKMRYQILPFLVCVPFAVANEYSALSDASTARDFYFYLNPDTQCNIVRSVLMKASLSYVVLIIT